MEYVDELSNIIDGLVFIGGVDIDERIYNSRNNIQDLPNRDLLEIEFYKKCKKKKIPILGICRGMQIINVAENGTLENIKKDNIVKHTIDQDGFINYHEFILNPKTNLSAIMQIDKYYVCSMHHQKIKKLGENLRIAAKSEDDIIEAIESTNKENFIIAFQGHIEKCITNLKIYNKVIEEFLKKVREYNNGKKNN